MTITRLTSKANPLLKIIRTVLAGSRNAPKQLAAVEGIRVLKEIERWPGRIDSVVISEHFGSAAGEKDLLDAWQSSGARIYRVGEKLFESLSALRSPQGALALVRMPEYSLHKIAMPENPLVVYACAIQDPGNLGTLIRTAAAAGACLICTTKGTVSASHPKTIRSSAGTLFHIPVVEHIAVSDFRAFCSRYSIKSYRSDARAGTPYTDADLGSACAVLVGNEGSGMPQDEFRDFPGIRIPMAPGVESLNVAAAGAIILYEAFNQRRRA